MAVVPPSKRWGYVKIITGTILGGMLGFYVMHRVETSQKEYVKKRLEEYHEEQRMKEESPKKEELKDPSEKRM
ncbi:hypothetical protein GIB67_016695 [Kingdonia uniflora]|uniref:Uncharacterized protein n=1 Tax=Kingdonia uniflora TaxID=39325 RepID=A0A7J7LMQ7_9MAGN|nr:hypothetical protein GIB67_016695 [Kingdonia uniflora]